MPLPDGARGRFYRHFRLERHAPADGIRLDFVLRLTMLKGGDLHLQSHSQLSPVATMKRNTWFYALGLFVIALGAVAQSSSAKEKETTQSPKSEVAASTPGSAVE